jgi:hypothetical protein
MTYGSTTIISVVKDMPLPNLGHAELKGIVLNLNSIESLK